MNLNHNNWDEVRPRQSSSAAASRPSRPCISLVLTQKPVYSRQRQRRRGREWSWLRLVGTSSIFFFLTSDEKTWFVLTYPHPKELQLNPREFFFFFMTADLAYPHFRLLQDCDIQRLVPTESKKKTTTKICVGSSWPALIPKVYDCDSQETDHQTVRSSRSEFGSFGLPSPRKGFEDGDSYSRRVSGLLDNPPHTHTHTHHTHTHTKRRNAG